jgi:hypothetical protein
MKVSHAFETPIQPIDGLAAQVDSGSVELTIDEEARKVSVDTLNIQKRLVTYGEYKKYLDEIGSTTRPAYWTYSSEEPDRPLVGINLQDVLSFLEWMNANGNGAIYRLPTEAEWRLAKERGRIETEPGVGEFLLDYYSESWEDWPIEEGGPIRNPFGPVIGVQGPEEARNFVGIRVSESGEVERDPLAPDYTGLGFGFRLAWSLEGPGPLGERLIRQAQMQRRIALQPPPGARPPMPEPRGEASAPPSPPILDATPTALPTATQTTVPTPTMTAPPAPTDTPVPPSPTNTPVAMATPTATPPPVPRPSPTPTSAPVPAGAPPFLPRGGTAPTERFEARGCSLEVALPERIKANEFARFRLLAKNGFDEPKKLSVAVSLEVEALAHIEQSEGVTVYPAGSTRLSLQRPGARFAERATELPLLELADAEVPADATRVLEVPIRFSQPGKATLHVRATFLAAMEEPRLDLNLPEMGYPDQLGFPSKAYKIVILP